MATPAPQIPGKIYAIRSNQTEKYYIGSTTQSLAERMSRHRQHMREALKGGGKRLCRSIEILKYDDARIELLEECPCDTVEALRAREGVLIRERMAEIVNKNRPNRTREEYLTYLREWRARNPDYWKQWLQAHPGYMKQWRAEQKAKVVSPDSVTSHNGC